MKRLIVAALAVAVLGSTPAAAVPRAGGDQCSKACVERVKARERAKIRRQHRRALVREMRGYKRHPMPACTWEGESSWDPATGKSFAGRPFAPGRYLVQNPNSTASGKFQFLTSTWQNIGGGDYGAEAWNAKPVYQERMARVLARYGISNHWVNC